MKTSELTGAALDWAVAKCEQRNITGFRNGFVFVDGDPGGVVLGMGYCPSTYWAQGGPIIERERISMRVNAQGGRWVAFIDNGGRYGGIEGRQTGPTSMIAAMRCYVASKLGDEVDVPEGLI